MVHATALEVNNMKFNIHPRKISADKVLWMWAILMAIGLLVFYLIAGGFPARGTNLVFSQWWEDELDDGALQKVIKDFEKENPGITVRLEKKSRAEIKAMFTENGDEKKKSGAGIVSLEGAWINELESALAVPGAEQEGRRGRKGSSSQAAQTAALPGLRAIPVISFINPLFYNIGLLEASGFDRPPKNQTEFLSYSQMITKPGQYGAALALGDEDPGAVSRYLLSWIWSSGAGHAGNAAASSFAVQNFQFDGKQMIETLSFLKQLKPYLYADPFAVTEDAKLDIFMEGKAGMMIGRISDVKKIRKQMNGSFGITTIPGPVSYLGKPVFALSTWYVGIGANYKNREEAETFIRFLLGRASSLALDAFAVPGSGEKDPDAAKNDPLYAKAWDMYEAGEMVRELYGTGGVKKLNEIMYEEVQLMFDGRSPENTAEAIQKRWESSH
jgi:multiple sugar transport system substrate-binding protein